MDVTTSNDETAGRPSGTTPAVLRDAVHRLEGTWMLDRVDAALAPGARKLASGPLGSVLRGDWLGHALHPLLTDLPLGCWLSASLVDLTTGRRGHAAARRLVGLGLVLVPPTVAAGLVDWSDVQERGVRRVGAAHAAGNTVVALLYLLSWRARRRGHHTRGMVLALGGGSLACATGYLGGHLSFARGAGVGARGTLDQDPARERSGPAGGEATIDLIDIEQAAATLGVGREQIEVMVADELLVPREEADDGPRFATADVMSVRLLGG
jgi:uncharacterized membrane protein